MLHRVHRVHRFDGKFHRWPGGISVDLATSEICLSVERHDGPSADLPVEYANTFIGLPTSSTDLRSGSVRRSPGTELLRFEIR